MLTFTKKSKEADGVRMLYEAQAQGLQRIYDSCGNDPQLTQFYLGLNTNL